MLGICLLKSSQSSSGIALSVFLTAYSHVYFLKNFTAYFILLWPHPQPCPHIFFLTRLLPPSYYVPSRVIIVPLIIGDCTVTKNKVKLWDFFYSLTRTKSTCFDNVIRNRKLFCFILFYRKHHLP